MRGGEFINREYDRTTREDIGSEGGQLPAYARGSSSKRDSIGDVSYQNAVLNDKTEAGTIPYSGEVISVYDSRPINSLDFSHTDYIQWNITAGPPASLTLTATYNPPGGYITVLRGYRFEMHPVVPITYADLLTDIYVDGVAQLGYQGLMHGQILNDFVPCFILGGDSAPIVFQWRAPTGIASGVLDVRYMSVEFYGNLIQTTGAPLSLEIANKEVGLPVKTEQQIAQSRAMASLRRSRQRVSLFQRFKFF